MIKTPFKEDSKLNSSYWFIFLLIFSMIFSVIFTHSQFYNSNLIESNKLRIFNAGHWQLDSIIIDDNWSFINETYDWCSYKDGVYIIENVTIDASNPFTGGIIISDTDDPFIIKNCTIYNSYASEDSAAIKLIRVKNGILIENNFSNNNGNGIMTVLSENITIHQNIVKDNKENGIMLGRSQNITISSNLINNNEKRGIFINALYSFGPGSFTASLNNKIQNNEINHNRLSGIILNWCVNNTVSKNEIHYNDQYGIRLEDWCSGNTITNNHIIYIQGCIFDKESSSNISNNYCEGNLSIPGYNLCVLIICIGMMMFLRNKSIRRKD
ncbi:MAG: right-handed parallel beta-helix repeat-containing protein [Promethearchaeota archaeon]|nr:MAG: right-handed parallel beta-helix repeat-containing protein [Candidatus Lokiarchaeota archaeon]